MSDQYGLRRILGSRLRTSSPQNSKWPRKKDIPQSLFIYYNQSPLRYNQTIFKVIANSTARKKKWKFGQLSVNLGSVSSRRWVSRCTRNTLQADRGGLSKDD